MESDESELYDKVKTWLLIIVVIAGAIAAKVFGVI